MWTISNELDIIYPNIGDIVFVHTLSVEFQDGQDFYFVYNIEQLYGFKLLIHIES